MPQHGERLPVIRDPGNRLREREPERILPLGLPDLPHREAISCRAWFPFLEL